MRRARAGDRAAVLAFASTTWDGEDYIPDVFDDWLAAPDGVLLVALPQAGQAGLNSTRAVALARVAMLSSAEAWLEGLRVDPDVRGRSVATTLQVAELHWAGAYGARVVRYATSETNEGSHRLGARHGFHRIADWRSYGRRDESAADQASNAGGPVGDTAAVLERLRATGLAIDPDARDVVVADLWRMVDSDPTFAAADRLYEWRPWALQELTRHRFLAHLRRGEVLGWPAAKVPGSVEAGSFGALAILSLLEDPEGPDIHLATLVGDGLAALQLAQAVRASSRLPLRLRLPDRAPLLADLGEVAAASGFPGHGRTLHFLERSLAADMPTPEPDLPGLLVMEEPPRQIAQPPPLRTFR